jgi:hypothetical protein
MYPDSTFARRTGALTLLMAGLAFFGMLYVPSALIVPRDAATTAGNILASEGLFRLGIVSDAIVCLIEIALTVMLYVLLKPAGKTLALVAALARLAMTIIQGVNLINLLLVLLVLEGVAAPAVFSPEQVHGLAQLFLNTHAQVVLVWGLFFSLHLLVFGYLVYRSGYFPRVLGALLALAGLCYLIQSFGSLLFPAHKETLALVGGLSMVEIAFPLWLVFKGVRARPAGNAALQSPLKGTL